MNSQTKGTEMKTARQLRRSISNRQERKKQRKAMRFQHKKSA